MIDFYYAPTPNGWKIAIVLEEMGLEYETHLVRLTEGDQFAPEFLEISPNAKMPAIVDRDAPGGTPVSVFESGAIALYLAEKTGKFMPTDAMGRKETLEWLFWQVGNQGPMAGQLSHFVNYAPKYGQESGADAHEYAHARYKGEYERSLAVLDRRLAGCDYILDWGYSVVDMICFPWAFIAKNFGVALDDFPNVAAWRGRIKSREAVMRAINLHKDQQNQGPDKATAETNKILYNQDASVFRRDSA
jgi:GST-like protein